MALVKRASSCFMALAGCFLIAVGLELFLLPNQVTTGGIAGVSVLVSHMTEMKLSLLLFLFNLPFFLYGKKLAIRRLSSLLLAVLGVVIFTYVLHPVAALVDEPLLAALGGGTSLGLGIGLALRQGVRFDESEFVVGRFRWFRRFGAGSVVFGINIMILAAAGWVFGVEQALYSVMAHALAYCMMEAGFSGLSPMKRYLVRSERLLSLQEATRQTDAIQWMQTENDSEAYCRIHRSNVRSVKRLLAQLDPEVEIISDYEHARAVQ